MEKFNNRLLIIDDNTAIHEDFRKILRAENEERHALLDAEQVLFEAPEKPAIGPNYTVDSAYQGQEGLEMIRRANEEGAPYAMAFVDVRMPPGLDGIETIEAIWKEYPELQVAVCTAYSDYSWQDMLQRLGMTDNLLILKKPFDNIEVRQIACALTGKWNLNRKRLLERENLIEARRAAEEANNAKRAFLANMSHEIRTPMNAIIGMNYLMKQTALTLKQHDYASKIDSAAHALLGIINEVLDFSKIDAGKIELERVEFNLDDVLAHLTQLTELQAQKKSLEFKLTVAPNMPRRMTGDALRLGQVLLNLASNAIKFTEKGEVELAVAPVESEKPDTQLIRFTIKDTGMGISSEQVTRLFEPFTQADASTTRRFGGTGLGLAISSRFVKLMGGKIEVQSEPGVGSTFSFTAQFGRLEKSEISASLSSCRMAGVRRALIVNGDETSRHLLSKLLNDLSIATTFVKSCECGAREIAAAHASASPSYGLAFIDCSSPGTDWKLEAIRFKRNCDELGKFNLPALILLASEDMGDLPVHIEDTGYCNVLIKPITRSSLYDTIVRARVNNFKSASQTACRAARPEIDHALRGARVLLVEDNDLNQQIAVEILSIAGCEVAVASSGSEALAMLLDPSAALPEAVLMDVQMPEMDGCALTRRIRSMCAFTNVPILAMTADSAAEVRRDCLGAGMNDFVSKPVDSEELYSKLAYWISQVRNASILDGACPLVLPDIDFKYGLSLLGGNPAIYRRALARFQVKFEDTMREADDALSQGAHPPSLPDVSTVGGAAARLGLNALSKSIENWISNIQSGDACESAAARQRCQIAANEAMNQSASIPEQIHEF